MSPRDSGESKPRSHSDYLGYYATLGLKTEATSHDVQLAYEMLSEKADQKRGSSRVELDRAYRILMNPASRTSYDRVSRSSRTISQPGRRIQARRQSGGRLDDWRILAACLVILFGILTFVWYPLYGSRLGSFSAGDRLVDAGGAPFGTIVKSEESHEFPTGVRVEAYLIQLHGSEDLRWIPATDVKAAYHRAD